jgi:hypothetical protein
MKTIEEKLTSKLWKNLGKFMNPPGGEGSV